MELADLPACTATLSKPQDAIDALRSRSNVEVIAYLTFARTCQQDIQYSSNSSSLPIEEFNAVLAFRDWTDEAVMRQLQWARRKCRDPLSDFNLDTIRNEVNSDTDVNPYGLEKVLEKRQDQGFDPAVTERSSRKRKRGDLEHPYWCTICGFDQPTSYPNANSWKKHEKEHERTYHCLLHEMVEHQKEGGACGLCGLLRPDELHMSTHHPEACFDAQKTPLAFKRRYQLVMHLKDQHACTNGDILAEKWWKAPEKKAWSCGFCVALFSNITDRLQHIKLKHFDRSQTLFEWDPINVIKGLLKQPMINEAWLTRLEDKAPFTRQNLRWPIDDIPHLQRRLEIGVTTYEEARNLARDVLSHAEDDFVPSDTTRNEVYGCSPSTFPGLPSVSDQIKRRQNGRNLISPITSSLNLPGEGFPTPRSATGPNPYHSHSNSFHEQWSGDYDGDSGGLATPLSDVNFNTRLPLSQSSTGDVDEMIAEDVQFNDFIGN